MGKWAGLSPGRPVRSRRGRCGSREQPWGWKHVGGFGRGLGAGIKKLLLWVIRCSCEDTGEGRGESSLGRVDFEVPMGLWWRHGMDPGMYPPKAQERGSGW